MGLLDELLGGLAEGEPRREPEAPRGRAAGTPAGAGMSKVLMALLPVVLAMLANRGGAPSAGPGAGMGAGGLGDLLGQILGGGAGPRSGMAGPGGLGDLLDAFQHAGYAEQTRSWVGTGQNLPISPDVIGQVFGHDGLSQIAARTGLTEEETSAGLSQLLPEVVDKLTPDGQVPDLDALAESVGQMARRLRA